MSIETLTHYTNEDDVKEWFDTVVREEFLRIYHEKSDNLPESITTNGYTYARCVLSETAKRFTPKSDMGKNMLKKVSNI